MSDTSRTRSITPAKKTAAERSEWQSNEADNRVYIVLSGLDAVDSSDYNPKVARKAASSSLILANCPMILFDLRLVDGSDVVGHDHGVRQQAGAVRAFALPVRLLCSGVLHEPYCW
jgi:hypothetical protein